MSSISSVSSGSSTYEVSKRKEFEQSFKDFKALGSALQSGDLSSAQSALATFQQTLQNNTQGSSNSPFGKNSQANTDYQTMANDLQSGDLSGAQKAFASLQTDLKATARGHHHHRAAAAAPAPAPQSASTTSGTDADGDADSGGVNATA